MDSAFTVTFGQTIITGIPAAMIIFGFIAIIFTAGYLTGRS